MKIAEFIQTEILLPRLERSGVLVVYDPRKRYRELCQGLWSAALRVVDATENSINSREAALRALTELGRPNPDVAGLLVYVPAPAPVSDEERQRDPFALYGACGSVFPEGDGDEFLSLCLKAKPDHVTAIRALFEKEPNPSFAVIDAVGSGLGWPTLRALLQAESSRDILFALLVPDNRQQEELKGQDAWAAEARDLFKAALDLKLKTRSKAWSTIGEELWRFLLFSEFIFDLPQTPPAAFTDVPHAPESARPLIEDLCDRLRNDQRTRVVYIDRAEAIEKELELPNFCAEITDLGKRDTFPFEERTFFGRAVAALKKENFDQVREIIRRHAGSVWVGKGESQAQWGLLIHDTLKRIRAAIHKLKKGRFHEVVIATDHGFFLNAQAEAGDVCAKPRGNWINIHERCLFGDGAADSHNFVIGADHLGIRGDFSQAAGPRSMAPYRSGLLYFHGGASLQEAVVPVIRVTLGPETQPEIKKAHVILSYKNGAQRITTRFPVFDVRLEGMTADLFLPEREFEILLEAHDKRGNVVGEAKSGGPVNAATGAVTLPPGKPLQVTLKMELEFEGKFTVKALNPKTLTTYCSLDLETDYAV